MVEGLEEREGILRTHKALKREVFFPNEFSQCTRYMVCSSLIENSRILKKIGVLPLPPAIHFC